MKKNLMSSLAVMALAVALASPAAAQRTGGAGAMNDHRAAPGSGTFRPEDARDPFNRGIAAFDSGDFALARTMFEEALRDAPDDAPVLVLLGMSMSGTKNFVGARRQFEHALRVDRQNLDAHRELGLAAAKTGDAKTVDRELKWLKAKLASCPSKCDDPGKVERAVSAVEAAMSPAKSG
jgi:Tfp pilus assembly protein PilF